MLPPRGLWPPRCEGRQRPGALPPPAAILLGAVGARCPRALGTGVRVRGQAPSPWPVFSVFLRGGQPGFRGPRVPCEGHLRSGAPPPPTVRPLGGLSGSVIHSCCGRGCAGVGARRCPLGLHAPWGPRSAGWWGPFPGGWSATVPRGVWCQALSLLRLPALWAGRRGPPPACCWRGCAGLGARHCPLSLHALWELRAAGGVARHRCEGRLVSDAVPPLAARPLGRAAGVLRPVCPRCRRCGRGDPAPAPQRAALRAGVARRGGGGRASPGGVPSTVARGV